ncbi:MAG: cobalamin-binding protein [Oscillatoriaceae bacterium SKW80]|nr:cobalamin-binding protein [Oscillatoriaceae bacterium SKYG93]MCX8121027.1 cobalamin-binding protein [Oscillatoriaceae bacterium SKW80]MDW8452300.1 cobalamin-binding protein [Oscillatoriaceae cyanobacterium SKYGB_i_bin93]HIK26634.1 cobalamin-binding protein [Oscillatoriaceae cyanobacterium M7585_C2015_266]
MEKREKLRIVSLLPSATEIVACLGLANVIVGRSHECDYPPEVKLLPACTQPKFNPVGSSREIHDRVTDLLQKALSVYQVKIDIIQQLQPSHIITQAQCNVCACSLTDVEKAVHNLLGSEPQIISLQPNLLAEIWQDIERVATALGVDGKQALASLQSRVDFCANQTYTTRPTVACIEWLDPLMAAGNWVPELVTLAGGEPLFGITGKHSPWLKWDDLVAAEPQVIIFMPCGFDLERTRQDTMQVTNNTEWQKLQAFRNGKVYVTDGNSYFNRPGPRLVDSLEILAEILHPEKFQFGYQGTAWEPLETWQ